MVLTPLGLSQLAVYAGAERGGHAAATAFSLIATCKLHGINPYDYPKAIRGVGRAAQGPALHRACLERPRDGDAGLAWGQPQHLDDMCARR